MQLLFIILLMISPICHLSGKQATKVCVSQLCTQSPFICKSCQNQQCQNLHAHDGQLKIFKWSTINNLIIDSTLKNAKQLQQNVIKFQKDIQKIERQLQGCLQKYIERIQQYNKLIKYDSEFEEVFDNLKNGKLNLVKGKNMKLLYQKLKSNNFCQNTAQISKKSKQQTDFFQRIINHVNLTLEDYQKAYELRWKKQDNQKLLRYNEQIRLNQNASAYFSRGCLYYSNKQLQKALPDFNKAIQKDGKNASAYYNRALLYKSKNELDLALSDYTKAIEFDNKNVSAYNNRGSIYYNRNEIDKALLDYDKVIEYDPKYGLAYINRGIIYNKKNMLEQAYENYSKAIELQFDLKYAYQKRANILKKLNRIQEAELDEIRASKL